jgi:hypothetical protein
MKLFQIPDDLRDYSVRDLQISVRTRNALLRNDFVTLGDLDGFPVEALLQLPGIGIGSCREIEIEIPFSREARLATPVGSKASECGAVALHSPPLPLLPPQISNNVVSVLQLSTAVKQTLVRFAVETLGDLAEASKHRALWSHLTPRQANVLRERWALLSSIPGPYLQRLTTPGNQSGPAIPHVNLETLQQLSNANTLDGEVRALVTGLSERDAEFVLQRWCYFGPQRPGLAELGEQHGVSRERVRQIVTRADEKLRNSGLRLPIGSEYLALLNSLGGAASTEQFRNALKAAGLTAEEQPIDALPSLSELGLIPPVQHSRKLQLWITDRYDPAGLKQMLTAARRQVRKELGRHSSIRTERLDALSQFGRAHMLRLAGVEASDRVELSDFVVPLPIRHSSLLTAINKVLAVTRRLRVSSLYRGLSRAPRLSIPPFDVVLFILAHHEAYGVDEEHVWAIEPFPRESHLAGAELLGVEIMEENGGVMSQPAFVDAMVERGYSAPMANVVLRSPFVRRVSTAVYALRGRRPNPDLMRTVLRRRRESRSKGVATSRWVGDTLVTRYRLTSFSSRQGVLAKPSALQVVVPSWRARYPDGTENAITIRNGFVWPVRDWIRRNGLRRGDLLIATFYPAEHLVEWDFVRAEEAS